jgi:hypothetical protein
MNTEPGPGPTIPGTPREFVPHALAEHLVLIANRALELGEKIRLLKVNQPEFAGVIWICRGGMPGTPGLPEYEAVSAAISKPVPADGERYVVVQNYEWPACAKQCEAAFASVCEEIGLVEYDDSGFPMAVAYVDPTPLITAARELRHAAEKLLRQAPPPETAVWQDVQWLGLSWDHVRRLLRRDGIDPPVHIPHSKAGQLVEVLLRQGGRFLSRQDLVAQVWSDRARPTVEDVGNSFNHRLREAKEWLKPLAITISDARSNEGYRIESLGPA